MCDEIHFNKGKTGPDPDATYIFNPQDMTIDRERQLVCPECHHGDELRLIETCRVERKLGDVTTNHTEYLELIELEGGGVYEDFSEIGVACGRCGFRHIGDNWKAVLESGEVVK